MVSVRVGRYSLTWALVVLCLWYPRGGSALVIRRSVSDSHPIYGPSGQPSLYDIKQTTTPDCGFASVMGALVHVSPEWISTHFLNITGSMEHAAAVDVRLYDPDSLQERKVHVRCEETVKNTADRTDVWWPGALEHAAIKIGLPCSSDKLGPVLPSDSLRALTGLPHDSVEAPDADLVFQLAQVAAEKKTPMVLQTRPDEKGGTNVLAKGHAYALFKATTDGSDRMITLFNPWGSADTYRLDDIVSDTYIVWYLEGYATYTTGAGRSPTTTKTNVPVHGLETPSPTDKSQDLPITESLKSLDLTPVHDSLGRSKDAEDAGLHTTTLGNVVVEEEVVTITVTV